MGIIDIIIITLISLSVFLGLKKGFFKSLFSLLAIVFSFYFASYASSFFTDFTKNIFLHWLFFVTAFIIFVWILSYLGQFIHFLGKMLFSSMLDKVLGVFVGLIRGTLLCGIIIFSIVALGFKEDKYIKKSLIAPTLIRSVKIVSKGIPDIFKKRADKYIDKIK